MCYTVDTKEEREEYTIVTMKMYAKKEWCSPYGRNEWKEVAYTKMARWPSGWFETYVFTDRSQEKVKKCVACYVFEK